MAYGQFTIAELKKSFGLVIDHSTDLFPDIEPIGLPAPLSEILGRYLPLAVNARTEKARSELLIAPVLIEFKLHHGGRVSLFSGVEFNVDEATGLKGRCDYLLSLNDDQLEVTAPVCVLVEAKNEDVVAGIPQCLAEMVAAQVFNERKGVPQVVHGIVATGTVWRFLRLKGKQAWVDRVERSIHAPETLYAILSAAVFAPDDRPGPPEASP